MAGHLDPLQPKKGPNESVPGSPGDAPGTGPTTPAPTGHASIVGEIEAAQENPPVGVILVGWDAPQPSPEAAEEHEVERSIVFALTACAGRSDRILASANAEVALIRWDMSGPATAEALADRIAHRIDIELDRLSVSSGNPITRWAIGVATSREGDRAADLLRYAETALNDAWLLGGRRPVAFDDNRRDA